MPRAMTMRRLANIGSVRAASSACARPRSLSSKVSRLKLDRVRLGPQRRPPERDQAAVERVAILAVQAIDRRERACLDGGDEIGVFRGGGHASSLYYTRVRLCAPPDPRPSDSLRRCLPGTTAPGAICPGGGSRARTRRCCRS